MTSKLSTPAKACPSQTSVPALNLGMLRGHTQAGWFLLHHNKQAKSNLTPFTQVNYLIDEGCNIGKGGNCIISLLHHFLAHHNLGETSLTFHADNCSGQNKNRFVMQYLAWRVMTGLNQRIEISFMMVGHTKFAPDYGSREGQILMY